MSAHIKEIHPRSLLGFVLNSVDANYNGLLRALEVGDNETAISALKALAGNADTARKLIDGATKGAAA